MPIKIKEKKCNLKISPFFDAAFNMALNKAKGILWSTADERCENSMDNRAGFIDKDPLVLQHCNLDKALIFIL